MDQELLINVTPQETRVALLEHGILQEVFIERSNHRGLVGNIYMGKVSRVLPGMQAAFIEVGLERTAFLHVSDIGRPHTADPADQELADDEEPAELTINEVLREGQKVMVQVIKDPLGSKGARLTTHISLPSRYLVFMPDKSRIGVSIRIEEDSERQRLRSCITSAMEAEKMSGGFIVRTAGEGVAEHILAAEVLFLKQLWSAINQQAKNTKPGKAIHLDLPLMLRILRDQLHQDTLKVSIDSQEGFHAAREFVGRFFPHLTERLEYYSSERPIFDLHGVEDDILRSLGRVVDLKSGGHLVFDQTEAMTTVDVNTGAYVGYRNLEETIFKTNLEAAQAIARQLRLRNLGGIIIIDFIDMCAENHRIQVLAALTKAMAKDPSRCSICEMSPLGLVEMTRKRTRESLEHILCEPCSQCDGRGSVRTVETICYEIFREIMRSVRQFETSELLILASSTVTDALMGDESTALAELENFVGRAIKVQSEAQYLQYQYDVVLL